MSVTPNVSPTNPANTLGLNYRAEAKNLPWTGPIVDIHLHLNSVEAARMFFQAADAYNVQKVVAMSRISIVDDLKAEFGDRIEFNAVPDFSQRDKEETFTTQWLRDIEAFAVRGCRLCKFWAAPRGRDFSPHLLLDAPIRLEAMKLARSLGMAFMVHVADPDTWFATKYKDANKYGSKASQYEPLERLLDEYPDVPWIAAHMGGHPEDLDHLQQLLDRHPNLHLDTSATKWMVRELSKHPRKLKAFLLKNPGRILFGSDIVASADNIDFDLYASRYWALRTMFETDYAGPSPIVDPDLHMVDPSLPEDSTAQLRGCELDPALLKTIYHDAATRFFERLENRKKE
ncbi:MAG: amidohydrolase family protein [Phycisphaera sp.]|nr:amidohydrolase family protein [Phycisphaera sp.]